MKSPYHYETNYTRSVNATGFDRFLQVSQKVTCFFWYYLPPPSKQYFIWKLFHPLSKAHSFDILNYSYLKKSNNTFVESENIELNITATDSRIFCTLAVTIYSTNTNSKRWPNEQDVMQQQHRNFV